MCCSRCHLGVISTRLVVLPVLDASYVRNFLSAETQTAIGCRWRKVPGRVPWKFFSELCVVTAEHLAIEVRKTA